jgi:hypothetical protein
VRRLAALLALLAAALLVGAPPALADFGLKELNVAFENEDGTPATIAGSHPFSMTTTLGVNTEVVPGGAVDPETDQVVDGEVPEGELKDLTVAQMPGLIGDQTAVPRCSPVDFATRSEGYAACPDKTAVGIAAVKAEFNTFPVGTNAYLHLPIYNLEPPPGVAAEFGFVAANVPVTFDVGISEEAPYRLVVQLRNTPQALLFYSSKVTLWGNPTNPAHDPVRGKCVASPVEPTAEPISLGSCPVPPSERPLLTLPRNCRGPLSTIFAATSWQGAFDEGPALTAGMNNCGQLTFSPQIAARPTAGSAESASGLDFDLDVDDKGLVTDTGNAQADIAGVATTLPPGMTANPSAAEGLGVCTRAQFSAAGRNSAGCPEASKLGTVTIQTPLLEEAVSGSVYLAQPDDPATAAPGAENPFDSLLATYLVIENAKLGLFVKQAGKIEPDPKTGQLTTTFTDIPELPFAHLHLHFREGPRAPLVTPPRCGTYAANAVLTPSSGTAPVARTSEFTSASGPGGGACPPTGLPPFRPGFTAGSLGNAAGAYSPFYIRLTRGDGEQDITRFDSILPPGLVARIAGVPRCSDAAIAAAKAKNGLAELANPSCPAGSQIGRIVAGAGVGPALTYVSGKVYLAGPYNGDPLSVVVLTPAVAGPFDLGTVITREALDLDPTSAEVQVDGSASEPIPHILEGIPVRLRDLEVYVDRGKFTLNPTSCQELSARATLFGSAADVLNPADDIPAQVSDRYQAAGCAKLGFKPRLALKFKGGTTRGDHPALKSTLRPRVGDANVGRAVVTLPHSELIDNAHIQNPCTRVQFAANRCPRASILGKAKAFTPLLDKPLEGPVYFRSNGGERPLPDIVADLHGQFHIVVVGFVDSKGARVRTTFAKVPDAPVRKFQLNLFGGKRGLLVNSRNLCARKLRANLRLTGQNGKARSFKPVVGVTCKGKGKKRR